MTLEEVRKEIDAIDQQLLPLFLKRMDCAKQVAEIKREQHLPVLNSSSTSIPVPSRSFLITLLRFLPLSPTAGRTSVCCRWKIPPPVPSARCTT